MLIDRNISEKENLLNHVNKSLIHTDPRIGIDEIAFTYPTVIPDIYLDTVNRDDPNSEYVFDTIVTVIPSDEFNYDNPVDIRYRRVNIGLQYELSKGQSSISFDKRRSETTLEEIKILFCDKCRLRNDSIDIRIEDTSEETIKRVYLTPIDHSLLYTGSIVVDITFVEEDKRLDLSKIINSLPLNGFDYKLTID